MRVSEAIQRFGRAQLAQGRSPQTITAYSRDLARLLAFAGDVPVAKITVDLLHRFLSDPSVRLTRAGSLRSERSLGRLKAALRSFGTYLRDIGALPDNPARGLSVRRTARKEPAWLSEAERKALVKAVNVRRGPTAERDRVMLALLLGTGIRLGELVGLDLADVDLEAKRITVRAKGGRVETRFLTSTLRRTLRTWLRRRRAIPVESDALFMSNRERRISARQVQARFKLWLAWAGIERPGLSVHSLRHTFGTRLYRRTHDLVLTGKALGHRSAESTRVYTHVDDAELEEALEAL